MIFDRKRAIEEAPSQSEIVEDFLSIKDMSENTVLAYRRVLNQYLRYLEEKRINKPDERTVNAYKKHILAKTKSNGEQVSTATMQLHIVVIRNLYKWAEEYGVYPDIGHFLHGVKVERNFIRSALTEEQANRLLDFAAEESKKGIVQLRDYTIIFLILNIGLRTVECSRADVVDIKEKAGIKYLYVQAKGRNGKDRPKRLMPYVVEALNDYIKARGEESGPLFLNHGNRNLKERIKPKVISKIVKKYLVGAGIIGKEYTAHSLRHTVATLALAHGASLQEVQEILGHSNIQTTTIYTHVTTPENNRSQDLLSEIYHHKEKSKEELLAVDESNKKKET